MNSLTIVAIAIVVLVAGYALYGRWIAKTWGIDPGSFPLPGRPSGYGHQEQEQYLQLLLPAGDGCYR